MGVRAGVQEGGEAPLRGGVCGVPGLPQGDSRRAAQAGEGTHRQP